jgi:hypothetical protein
VVVISQTSTSLWRTGQCPVPRLARWRTGRSREKKKALQLKITGPSGGAPDCLMSQRRPLPTVICAINGRHVAKPTISLSHRTVSGAPTGPEDQRSDAPDMEGNRAPNRYCSCPVVHRTNRCTTRQKARFAFQVDLQRLLAALGL